MTVYKEFAPAKINLTLNVLGKRADGYHELESLVAFADVGDNLTLDTSKPTGVTTSGPFAGSIASANIVEIALRRLEIEAPQLRLGAVTLEKNLPVAAGIGGGSADAAALIRAVKRANAEQAETLNWNAFALRLGADVPVCLQSKLSWMRGIGEKVTPLSLKFQAGLSAVIVNPLVPMPPDKTAQVFKALQADPLSSDAGVRKDPPAPQTPHDLLRLIWAGKNDLQRAAVRSEIQRAEFTTVPAISCVLSALSGTPGCRIVRLSGAGPTFFALYDPEADPRRVAEVLQAAHPDWWVKFVVLC